ncbi:unnamed protein product [Phytomonas sp. EM1]|nr:unnamed protein product [Phytomonas sp. EM1]|eukprot:CCW61050.1 unnamed protein product [Phytomonas sp. isolate EM1]
MARRVADSTGGVRAHEGLRSDRKASLSGYLRTQTEGSEEWATSLGSLAKSTIARRVCCNESLDAGAIVGEVAPIVRARMPEETREGLFRRAAAALYGDWG